MNKSILILFLAAVMLTFSVSAVTSGTFGDTYANGVTTSCSNWDKSSLKSYSTNSTCDSITVKVCNGGRDMRGTATYKVYYSEDGNPKYGTKVYTGTVPKLRHDRCTTLTYNPTKEGNYKFKIYQRPGHSGTGYLWSNTIKFGFCDEEVPEFGVVAGAIALVGAFGIFLYRRKD